MSAEERTRQLLLMLLLLLLQDLLLKAANEADCLINEREGGKFSPPLRQRPQVTLLVLLWQSYQCSESVTRFNHSELAEI